MNFIQGTLPQEAQDFFRSVQISCAYWKQHNYRGTKGVEVDFLVQHDLVKGGVRVTWTQRTTQEVAPDKLTWVHTFYLQTDGDLAELARAVSRMRMLHERMHPSPGCMFI